MKKQKSFIIIWLQIEVHPDNAKMLKEYFWFLSLYFSPPMAKHVIFRPFNFRHLSNWQNFQYKIPQFAFLSFRSPSTLRVSNFN